MSRRSAPYEDQAEIPSQECPCCGCVMLLALSVPAADGLPEVRGFRCVSCGETSVEEFDPSVADEPARFRPRLVETPPNKRNAKRHAVEHNCTIYDVTGEAIGPCRLRNISETGAQIELKQETDLPQHFILTLPLGGEVRRRCQLVWKFSAVAGLKFMAVA